MQRSGRLLPFFLATAIAFAARGEETRLPGKLYWANGDILPGDLLDTTDGHLAWQSPLFREPLLLSPAAISAVRFDAEPDVRATDAPFRVTTRSGNVLHGELKDITADTIVLQSRRHGLLTLRRNGVRSLRRLNNPSLIYLGPTGLAGWKTLTTGQTLDCWRITDEGHLTTTVAKAELFRPLEIPGRAEIELVVEASEQVSFFLGLDDRPSENVHLETWDDTLVALVDDEFEEVRRLGKKETVTLRLYWDEKSGQLSVFSESGAELGSIKGKPRPKRQSGIFLRNTGRDLTVHRVRVSHWDGSKPQPVQKGESRIHLTDGTLLYGSVDKLESDQLTIRDQSVPLDQIDSIYLADDARTISDGSCRVAWSDGTSLSGELAGISAGRIRLQTSYSDQPIVSDLGGASRLVFTGARPGTPADEVPDTLYCSGGTLHGTLQGNGDDTGADALRWRPLGGINSSPLAPDCAARFVRGSRTTQLAYDKKRFGDLLYLTSGDIVPCRVLAIDEEALQIETAFGSATTIGHEHVKAIELASSGSLQTSGFGDSNWKVVGSGKNVLRSPDKVVFRSSGRVVHRNVVSHGEVSFKAKWQPTSYVVLNIRMLTNANGTGGTSVMLYLQGNHVWATDATNGFRGRTQSMNLTETTARVQLQIKDDKLILRINDRELHTTKVNRSGSGLTLQVSQNQAIRGGTKSELEVSDFLAHQGTAVRQFVDSEARDRALTVPRFRRDRPPTHVVIAPNGDLLRGHLIRVTENQVWFTSRLEDFRFERSRIAAIIWLHPEGEAEPPRLDATAPVVRAVLDGGLGLVLAPERMTEEQLVGRSAVLGQCSIPVSAIRELYAGNYSVGEQRFAYADWSVTPGMEPRWDATDSAGTDPARALIGQAAGDFTLKTLDGKPFVLSQQRGKYVVLDFWATWCGPCVRAMPEYLAAMETLPQDKVLFVAVNQAESAPVISEFLKRREWNLPAVLLDADQEVAASFQVAGIPHTVIVGPDGTIEWVHTGFRAGVGDELRSNLEMMLAGTWQRPAAEAETISGTESRLVGTAPDDFALTMLDGTRFQLSDARGKVVILDFWATWCGPCVRALPEYLKMLETLDGQEVLFIAVNQAEKPDLIKDFLEKRKLKMPVGLDPDGKVADAFDVTDIPQTVVIGPDGTIRWLHTGYRTGVADALRLAVGRLLSSSDE